MIYLYIIGAIVVLLIAFLRWRWTSVERGARQRDEKLLVSLNPIAERLAKREAVEPAAVADLARQPQYRPMLYQLLKHFERLDLFPEQHLSRSAQAEGSLAYWLMHPNELQDAPEVIECVEEVQRDIGQSATFVVLRYRMPPGHWAAKDGWLLGLSGPFIDTDVPYSGMAQAFSRCGDKEGDLTPTELIDWYVGIASRKSE